MNISGKREFVLLAFALLLTLPYIYAQKPSHGDEKAYALLDRLSKETDKSSLMEIHGELGHFYEARDLSLAKKYFQEAKELSEELSLKSDFWYYHRLLALVEFRKGDYKKSLELHDEHLAEIKESQDSILIYYYYGLGLCHQQLFAYEDAHEFYKKVETMGDSLGDHRLSTAVLGLIAKVYKQQGDFPKALKKKKEALARTLGTGEQRLLAYIYKDLGNLYLELGQLDSASYFTHKGIDLALHEANTSFIAGEAYEVLCRIYAKDKAYTKALEAAKQALALGNSLKSQSVLLDANHSLAQVYLELAQYNQALIHAYQAQELVKSLNNFEKSPEVYHLIQKIYEEKNDLAQAYKYQGLAYEAEKKFQQHLRELEDQRKDYLLNKEELRSQEVLTNKESRFSKIIWIYAFISLILLISIILILFVFRREPLFNRIHVSNDLNEVEKALKVRFIRHASLIVGVITGFAIVFHLLWGSPMQVLFASATLLLIGVLGLVSAPQRLSIIFYCFAFGGYSIVSIFPLFVGPLYTGFLALTTIYLTLNYLADRPLEYIMNLGLLLASFIAYLFFMVEIPTATNIDSIGIEAITALGCTISIVTIRYYTSTHTQVVRKELYKNRLFLEEISDINPYFILSKDLEARVTYANETVLQHFNLKKQEILGQKLTDLIPESQEIRAWELEKKVILDGETLFIPAYKVQLNNQEIRYVDIIKKPIYDEYQEIVGILMVGVDTTEKRQVQKTLEEREMILNSIINTLPDPVFVIGMDQSWQIYNKAFPKYMKQIFGSENVDLPHWVKEFPADIAKVWNQKMQHLLSEESRTEHIKFPTQSGDHIDMEVYQSLLINKEEEKIGFLFMGRDETEKIYKEEIIRQQVSDLNLKNQELKKYIESNSHLEQFAYLASHDLRTPIRTLVSFTQLLKRKTESLLGEDEKEYMNFIIRASKNMMTLVNDILSFSKVNTSKVQLEIVNVASLVEEILEEMQVQIEEKEAQVSIKGLPENLLADKTKFRQLFQNLITNALKFSKKDQKPSIDINARKIDAEWKFWVKDNGIGIKEEYQQKIFLLFNRLHSDIEVEGFGIGLAICKKIVEQHEGEIGLDSTFGQGSNFYFSIPIQFSENFYVDENGNIRSTKN